MSRNEAIRQFEDGSPTTAAFKAVGFPFEAFLQWAQIESPRREENARRVGAALRAENKD